MKKELFLNDLNRFNIKTILIDEYSEITDLLRVIERNYKTRTIFISGAAHEYGSNSRDETLKFIHDLSGKIIKNNFKIVSGFGLGIGSALISGALDQIYMNQKKLLHDELLLRPFPQSTTGTTSLPDLWSKYRNDMLAHSGTALFLYGNKMLDGTLKLSNGMMEEYEIAKSKNILTLPVGATGYMSKKLWEKELEIIESNSKANRRFKELFIKLGDKSKSFGELTEIIIEILKLKSQ